MLNISIKPPLRGNPFNETPLINNPLGGTPLRRIHFLNPFLLFSFGAIPTLAKSESSFSEWGLADNNESLSANAEYWISSDLILSLVVLGWFLSLWLLQKTSPPSMTEAGPRTAGQRTWKHSRRKFFMFSSPKADVCRIYRHLRF